MPPLFDTCACKVHRLIVPQSQFQTQSPSLLTGCLPVTARCMATFSTCNMPHATCRGLLSLAIYVLADAIMRNFRTAWKRWAWLSDLSFCCFNRGVGKCQIEWGGGEGCVSITAGGLWVELFAFQRNLITFLWPRAVVRLVFGHLCALSSSLSVSLPLYWCGNLNSVAENWQTAWGHINAKLMLF